MNFDGLVGQTHNYSGLSLGNIASMEHGSLVSNPKKAALQGLAKMRLLTSLGIKQGILPPQERPLIPLLQALGFKGSDREILEKAWKADPKLLLSCSSSASMWAANAATVSPSADSNDGRVHFTPANLISKFHRSIEAGATGFILYRIFNNPAHFAHHPPLPPHPDFADEGAANHCRFCDDFGTPGIQLFVYGRSGASTAESLPKKFPPRQAEEASKAIARLHRLSADKILFIQQNPDAIDAGVFHNDVISVGHKNVFFYHERAFLHTAEIIRQLEAQAKMHLRAPLALLEVKEADVSLEEAVKTYLFNSQIISLPDATMALIAPEECKNSSNVHQFLEKLLGRQQQPIRRILYQDVRESMQNGGGPACLRLRVALKKNEYEAMDKSLELTEELYAKLTAWVEKHYRDRLNPQDLADPQLLFEERVALDELTSILKIGPIYFFQQMSGPPPPLPEKRR